MAHDVSALYVSKFANDKNNPVTVSLHYDNNKPVSSCLQRYSYWILVTMVTYYIAPEMHKERGLSPCLFLIAPSKTDCIQNWPFDGKCTVDNDNHDNIFS